MKILQQRTLTFGMLLGLGSFLMACNKDSGSSTTQFVKPLADNATILEFNGGKVTAGDVKQFVEPRVEEMDEELGEIYRQMAERMLVQKLIEADVKKQGVNSVEELFAKIAPATEATDEQVNKFLKDNDLEKGFKDPKSGKRTPVKKDDVKRFLSEQERQNKQQAYLQGLMANANPKSVLPEKTVEVPKNAASPILGNAGAKVVIHEFSDFECPYCANAHALAGQINQAYGDKVAFYFRHLPLTDKHPQAMPAAIASQCANKQGKFWAYHDKLFQNYRTLSPASFKQFATELGLDIAKFDACLAGPEASKEVAEDMEAARKAKVNGTPSFFINGKRVRVGPQIESFKKLIDAELAKK